MQEPLFKALSLFKIAGKWYNKKNMTDQTQRQNSEAKRTLDKAQPGALAGAPELQPLALDTEAKEKKFIENAEQSTEAEQARAEQPPVQREQGAPSFHKPLQPPEPPSHPRPKSKVRKRIEAVMTEDLSELYQHMDPPTKAAFKTQAQIVASRIEEMIATATVRARDIIELIRAWLRMIPGMNKFFLEQETKIKSDKIADIAMNKHKYQ